MYEKWRRNDSLELQRYAEEIKCDSEIVWPETSDDLSFGQYISAFTSIYTGTDEAEAVDRFWIRKIVVDKIKYRYWGEHQTLRGPINRENLYILTKFFAGMSLEKAMSSVPKFFRVTKNPFVPLPLEMVANVAIKNEVRLRKVKDLLVDPDLELSNPKALFRQKKIHGSTFFYQTEVCQAILGEVKLGVIDVEAGAKELAVPATEVEKKLGMSKKKEPSDRGAGGAGISEKEKERERQNKILDEEMSDYERKRLENIREKDKMFESLQFDDAKQSLKNQQPTKAARVEKKPKEEGANVERRKSSRIFSRETTKRRENKASVETDLENSNYFDLPLFKSGVKIDELFTFGSDWFVERRNLAYIAEIAEKKCENASDGNQQSNLDDIDVCTSVQVKPSYIKVTMHTA